MARRELSPACLAVVQAVAGALPARGIIRIGVSGGADSLALARAVAHLARKDAGLVGRIEAVVVDHGLQDGSAGVAERARIQLAGMGLDARVAPVRVDEVGGGVEAAARLARYQALTAGLSGDDSCLLGHTMDDQAETVLLGLARGSGIRSLAGMAAESILNGTCLVRPLLGIRRATTRQACADWGLAAWSDPHNAAPRFARVRVRERVIPVMEAELGPGVVEALARTAALARADADELDAQAARLRLDSIEGLAVPELVALPGALATRVIRSWLFSAGVDQPSYAHVASVWALVADWHGQQGVDLPGGRRVRRIGHRLVIDADCRRYGR